MAKAIPARPPLRPNTIVLFGDSLTAANNPAVSGMNVNAVRFFHVANALHGRRLSLVSNAGVSGNTTSQMLARIASDVLSYKPGYAHILGGTNDPAASIVYGDINAPGSTISNLFQIYERLRAAGIFRFIGTISTRQDYSSNAGQSRHNGFVNEFIRWYCRNYPGCALVDYAYALSDPATGRPNSSWVDTSDSIGVHPQDPGGMIMGLALADSMAGVVPMVDDAPSTLYDHTNMNLNPMCLGNNVDGTHGFALTTGVTGTGPNGMQAYRRSTGTAVLTGGVARTAPPSGTQWRQDTCVQIAASFAAANDGAGIHFGGSEVQAKGRYDQTWTATTAFVYGDKRNPSVANGMIAHCLVEGTSGASEPTWGTAENAQVTDGSVTWIMRRKPVAGDQYVAQVDLYLSGLTGGKGALPVLDLSCIDTTATVVGEAQDFYHDISGSAGGYPLILPSGLIRLRTPVLTLPSFGGNALRYLRARLVGYGDAGGTLTMLMARAGIVRVAP